MNRATFANMKVRLLPLIVSLALTAAPVLMSAQCAMCRATAESASENVDQGIGQGLNAGIIYLMGIPYLLLATVVILFFRKRIASFFRA
jgi:hypothetical protein